MRRLGDSRAREWKEGLETGWLAVSESRDGGSLEGPVSRGGSICPREPVS